MIETGSTDEFLTSATKALRSTGGEPALEALGWWDLLSELHDADARAAVFALFRAQGRELASTTALGGLLAQPYLEGTDLAPGTVVAAVLRRSSRRGPIRVVVGNPGDRRLLVDEPGKGAGLFDSAESELVPVEVAGRLDVHEVRLHESAWQPTIDESLASAARPRSELLGRIALASEILGAAETAVALAIEYAGDRRQFGQPIGSFQAMRHLLAWAQTDCVAVEAAIRDALFLNDGAPQHFDAIVKALAGRNGARACQRALQVFGGIGFTAEHDHHHFASRVMLLDALLGTSAEIRHDLGRWLRTTGEQPKLAEAVLLGASTQSS